LAAIAANWIVERHPAFSDIPSDLPVIGLVCTMERSDGERPVRRRALPTLDIPYGVQREEIEGLVRLHAGRHRRFNF